ncbi:hypothetical protein [Frigidibacter sp.]|uniref:hypothetical protein n=1 Tax=Frigidibacter sp. TaxID=2586418 RepID=UPI002736C007|nr:hypothetical protein [Frigidibacter sp.]MDP3338951.1 hypothetical protein [Frigidibacter sp.]
MTNFAVKLALVSTVILPMMAPSLFALSLGIGGDDGIGVDIGGGDGGGLGVDVGIGGDDGVGVGVGVGGGSGIGAGVSVGGAVDVGVSIGGSTPGTDPGTNPGTNPSNPSTNVAAASMPGRAEVAKAKRLVCRNDGNSEVYADYLVFDRHGRPVGVVASAWVGPDLKIDTLRFATLDSFASPAKCLTVKAAGARIGQGAIGLPHAGNDLQKAIALR